MFASLDARHYVKYTIFGSFRPDYLADIKAARPDAKTSILFGAVDIDPVKLAQAISADLRAPLLGESRAAAAPPAGARLDRRGPGGQPGHRLLA